MLLGGTWLNRNTNYNLTWHPRAHCFRDRRLDIEQVPVSPGSLDSSDALLPGSGAASPSLLATDNIPEWRERTVRFWGFETNVRTPNSRQFKNSRYSRVLRKFPFLQEVWYWVLIYWVCTPYSADYTPIAMQVLISIPLGISAWPRLHGRHPCCLHSRRSTRACSRSDPPRATSTHFLGVAHTTLFPPTSFCVAMDQPTLFLYPHPWHHPLSGLALLSHHDTKSHLRAHI